MTNEEPPAVPLEVTFATADSMTIVGDFYIHDKTKPTILLFHQAGSNARGEYRTIIPRLYENGYNVLAIDQRSGGQLYGSFNRVVADITLTRYGYCDAYPDLEAALNYVKKEGFAKKIILWGSSYSAALVVGLAHANAALVKGVLAFSPASGEPMEGCKPEQYLETLTVPLLVLRPGREATIESVKNQLDLAQSFGHQTYIAENGVHGSSMLVAERVGGDVEPQWKAVMTFLETLD